MNRLLLVVRGLEVRYGATRALRGVDLEARAGEIHAVVGENGAGKSTLLRAVAGFARPSAGAIQTQARAAWVPQEPDLPADLSAVQWIFLAAELGGRFGWLRRRAMEEAAAALLGALGCTAPVRARLGTLSAVQRKQAQLARALRGDPDLLLLDEPTAVLGEAETRRLFEILRQRRARGAAVLYVSHRLEEVLSIADRVTVLRDGERVACDPVAAADVQSLVAKMVGREVPPAYRRATGAGDEVLRLEGVRAGMVRDISLAVRRGEVVGLAGLVGAGRSELLECVAGLRPLSAGILEAYASPVLLPEDRARNGLVSALCLRENLLLPAPRSWIRIGLERDETGDWMRRLGIRATGTEAAIASLSGGNQQKLLLARVLRRRPALLLLDEPTAGVDVAAKADIHAHIARLAGAGTAVLMASSDLPELLQLCDRIVALREGRVAGTVNAAEATEASLAALITGAGAGGTSNQ
jgi:rhamnose transport system ATP-binding protein